MRPRLSRHEDAIEAFRIGIGRNPDFLPNHYFLAAALGILGRDDEAASESVEIERLNPGIRLSRMERLVPYKHSSERDRFIDGLRKTGLPE